MAKRQRTEDEYYQGVKDTHSALDLVSKYVAALASGDSERMNALRSQDFVLDFVYSDAFESGPLSE